MRIRKRDPIPPPRGLIPARPMAGPPRAYHHGDLPNALVTAAVELAAAGGPDAISVRAAARAVGVAPSAVYRHFTDREQLVSAVRQRVVRRLAHAMRQRQPATASGLSAAAHAYICFAVMQPGLFRTISVRATPEHRPFRVVDGVRLDPATEMAVWSAVHGLALLVSGGPLKDLPDQARDEAVEGLLAALARGL
nr:TetR-like C-terminal domain-containing protein [Kibdelosporangium sp. MJ126-NF4]CEL14257.1 Transcriptional regulator, TetR family [Kibdelosporangium sp. MJ126-NF4]CTQ88624.1 Transcriptional regulator, TetR family [Kibdelosporangium sp. MJ126-NF4]